MKRILYGIVGVIMAMPSFAGDPSGPLLPMGEYFCTVTYECGDGTGASHSYTNSDENNVVITVSENTTCSKSGMTFSHWAVTCPGFATPLSPVAYPGESYDTTGCSDDPGNNFVFTAVYTSDNARTTSKPYVDDQIATRQVKIPAANTAGVGAGDSVITYTNVAGGGIIGERGLFTGGTYDASNDADKLITASALNNTFTNLPTTDTTTLQCANQDCTLWTIVDQTAYGETITLPAGYTRLEYIQSTGTQYIDTGMASTNVNNVKAKISFTNLGTLNYILGTRPSGGSTTALGYILYSSTHGGITMYPGGWPEQGKSDVVVNKLYDIEASLGVPNILQVDGIEFVSYNHSLPTGNSSIYIFALHSNNDSGDYFASARLYSMSLYNDSELVANYIPTRKISDNAIGVYDTVSGQFFTNQGRGDFIAGPVVN